MTTKIEWTRSDDGSQGETWNPLRGCSLESPGCLNCYAQQIAHRFNRPGFWAQGLTQIQTRKNPQTGKMEGQPTWRGVVREVPDKLDEPLRWRNPTTVFVNSMSDLFHPDVDHEYIDAVFGVMAGCPQHTFQVLTKRPAEMRDYMLAKDGLPGDIIAFIQGVARYRMHRHSTEFQLNKLQAPSVRPGDNGRWHIDWPLPNVWLGVSVEDQRRKARIATLRETPAAIRFLSCEPLLEDLGELDLTAMDWVIVGGESGSRARPMDIAWARSIVEQCQAAGVPVFVKQLGRVWANERLSKDLKGGRMRDWPRDLQVRDMPAR